MLESNDRPSPTEATAALHDIEQASRQAAGQVRLPRWFYGPIAAGRTALAAHAAALRSILDGVG